MRHRIDGPASRVSIGAPLYASALVWDQTFPATLACGTWTSHFHMLERMKASGYSTVSITVANDPDDSMSAIRRHGSVCEDYRAIGAAATSRIWRGYRGATFVHV